MIDRYASRKTKEVCNPRKWSQVGVPHYMTYGPGSAVTGHRFKFTHSQGKLADGTIVSKIEFQL